ncbi:SDR family oxidoreductase [Janthinobacterium aquaticum]|uniref:SDR family oxidoreductase n=1 Tax=Janthinobacterium sp. FT58W TaxID=2654254 RepID=UPI0012651E3F|nr:SDR family oxidoreductase [Janthinobacterium sp. FT58W]KAB8044261.1 NAD-dependent epimerase/dehydratase family protein [Janthinobacterium sp. FT58W]
MRVLLTGSTGLLGAALVQRLLERGHQVIAAGRRPGHDARLGFARVDFADATSKHDWLTHLAGIDAVINTVGIFNESGAQRFATVHVAAPCALFDACAEAGVKLVIQLSALGADEAADTSYHLSKKAADDHLAALAQHTALRAYIVQPSLVYGEHGASSVVFRMLASLPLTVRLGAATQLVQPVHLEDAVGAIVALLDQSEPLQQRIALVGPTALPFVDYLATLRRAMGLGRQYVLTIPAGMARAAATLGAKLPGCLLTPDSLRMLMRDNTADVATTTQLLGHPPRQPQQFLTDPRTARTLAQLTWLLPMLRLAMALVWLWTAWVSAFVYPRQDSYALLERSGIPAALAPLMLYGASALDLLFGLATLFLARRHRSRLWLAQAALIGFYTIVIAVQLPEFLWHPYGPLSKNLPMLGVLWLLYALEKPPVTERGPTWNT